MSALESVLRITNTRNIVFVTVGALALACLAPSLLSQIDLSTAVAFEAATVKQSRSGAPARGRVDPGRFAATNTTVLRLLQTGFDIQEEERILNAPGWVRGDGYDIVGKAPDDVPLGPNLRPMLRRLLKDRFGMSAHVEERDMPIYHLVLSRRDSKPGPNIHQSSCDCRGGEAARCTQGPPLKSIPDLDTTCAVLRIKGRSIMSGYPMADFARMLTGVAGRVVVDRTGLSGTWNAELEFTPDQALPNNATAPNDPTAPIGPSLQTALEEQLGLKLQSARGLVDTLVIDHLERPTEN